MLTKCTRKKELEFWEIIQWVTKVEYYIFKSLCAKLSVLLPILKCFSCLKLQNWQLCKEISKECDALNECFSFFFRLSLFLNCLYLLSFWPYSVFIIYIFRPQKAKKWKKKKRNRCKNGCCKNHRHAQNSSKNMFCEMSVILSCSCTLFFLALSLQSYLVHCSIQKRIRRQKAARKKKVHRHKILLSV